MSKSADRQEIAENAGAESASPLTRPVLAAYSSLTIPIAAVGLPISVYLPPFYAEDIGLGLATVGIVFMLARIWDVVTDPIMGFVVDRFPSRWGRRRHWIVIGVPIMMVSGYLVYIPNPAFASASYLLVCLVCLYVGYTFLMIAHQSWGVDLTSEYDERSRLYGWREVALILGMTTILALPAAIEISGVTDAFAKVASMGWFLIVLLPIAAAIIVWKVPDKKGVPPQKMNWSEMLHLLRRNEALRRCLFAELMTALGVGATASTYIFLVKWVFLVPEFASAILLLYFIAGLIGTAVWMKLAMRIGKHNALIAGMIYGSATLLFYWMIAEPGAFWMLVAASILYGLQFGAGPVVLRAMVADVADQHELETGGSRAGLLFAALTTTGKLAAALAVGITFWLLAQIGFDPKADVNSPEATNGLLMVFVLTPMVCFVLAAAACWRYPLTQSRHREIAAQLAERRMRDAS